ncbi:MAG TPA: NUDIX domain-containing protein [Candidatus Saccharimonadales bacterium]|nr:NUDIX domain-containing protein [Candidatus Saccharimonadales bacterium]
MTERRVTVRGIVFKDKKILAQQLQPDADGIERDYWCTPGGGLEAGESLYQGLHREMIEETGIAPKIGKLLFIQQYRDENKEYLEFFFLIKNPEDYHTIDLAATSHGELEVKHVDFIDPEKHRILPAFLQTTDIEQYITFDIPPLVQDNINEEKSIK